VILSDAKTGMGMMDSILEVALSGLQVGSIYALMALGYFVIIRATGILNFAQGEWMMISGALGVTLLTLGVPYPLALAGGVAGAVGLALLAERVIIRPLQERNAQQAITLLALFGIMLVARYGTGVLFGRLDEPLDGPAGATIYILSDNAFLSSQTLVVYGTTAVIFVGVSLFMTRTWLGRSLRVASIDPLGASLMGIDLNRVRMVSFGLGALIAALCAWLYFPLYAVGYLNGVIPGIKGFIALFLGGMASSMGPLLGGLLLGVAEVAASRYLPSIYSEGVAFALLMVILGVRPSGLLGRGGEA
jgi:branched-chain amino acid transport system permease protein